ncbi:MAG TPA: hypothetical protein VLD67_10945, partial [Vicinamibacterales bacterium]|nr:hypothetical protein [Vicinamibacterales bacterium]
MRSLTTSPPRVVESAAAELRLAEARAFIEGRAPGEVLLVGASRGAVDDLARHVARHHPATAGLHRYSFTELAARLAAPVLAARGLAPSTWLGSEAVAARATFDARAEDRLDYFEPVASTPGFPRALARTIQELRLARVPGWNLERLPLGGTDLSVLLDRFVAQFSTASATDRAELFAAASEAAAAAALPLGLPLLLLDVPFDSDVEFDFVRAILSASPEALITVPFGDLSALGRLKAAGLEPDVLEQTGTSDLVALRRNLFARRKPPEREEAGDVRLFSAPGEGRECVEIARRIQEEARRGVPFDDIAVLLRSPHNYLGLLEHAFRRAEIPAWFDRGVRRPHPAGRAFLAILGCAIEKLSARRFAEYLSLAQVPQLGGRPPDPPFVPPVDEAFGAVAEAAASSTGEAAEAPEESDRAPAADPDELAVIDGALRAPWKWETLIVESSVIGGGAARWHRRLDGLAQEYRIRMAEEARDDPDSPVVKRIARDLRNLTHLRRFALPLIDELSAWPDAASWGEWLERFTSLAPRVLRWPEGVLRVLAELGPMSAIAPVSLREARDVLANRLLTLQSEPPRSRYGAVFVGSPHQARGRAFRVVFVPGLAERVFPQKPREDPMLLDEEMRMPLGAGLALQVDRGRTERLLLRLAVGAATERLWLSYPRIEVNESRPRVPSFYALDVKRAITGRIPDHEALQQLAAAEGGASLAWPAPADPHRAIDDLEHDLAVLGPLLTSRDPLAVKGRARYLLELNPHLRRSLTERWKRWKPAWTEADGLVEATVIARAALADQRL